MKHSKHKTISLTGWLLFASLTTSVGMSTTADAQTQTETRDSVYFTLPPSPEVLAAHLFGDSPKKGKTRSISFNKQSQSVPKVQKSVILPVLFHFGKTSITHESRPFLDNVGKMLLDDTHKHRKLVVEGHTDSIGTEFFNQGLSEQRALAIKNYLVSNYGINPQKLVTVGKGETSLYNTRNPKARENRRVEFLPFSDS